jgi:uncharacterized repeat protein (TIGR01451 family)
MDIRPALVFCRLLFLMAHPPKLIRGGRTVRNFRGKICLIMLAAMLWIPAGTSIRAAAGDVESVLSLFKVVVNSEGREELKPADKVSPSEIVEYQLVFTNKSKTGVKNLQPTLPVPEGMEYLPNTAKPAKVLASLDGKEFKEAPLKRQVKKADGTFVAVDVPYAEYRYLRWSTGDLAAGGKVTLSARMKVIK